MTTQTRWIAASLAALGCLTACGGQGLGPDGTGPADQASAEGAALTSCPGGSLLSGIDISYPQVNFNLAGAKANGDRFVYIGATYGITVQQVTYADDVKKAKDLGMIHGPYHFFVPSDDPNAQADNFLKMIGDEDPKGNLPPALDWEITNGVSWSESFARAKIFLDRVEKATGRTPVIYTYSDFFGESPPQEFAKYPLWIANTGNGDGPTCPPIPAPWDHWLFYQWNTSGGLDKDRFNGTLAELQAFAGGTTAPSAPSDPTPVVQSCQSAAAGEEPVLTACDANAINRVAPESAKAFLDRAYNWIDRGVMYSETSEYDGYRKDCSGFVSYVWQLTDHPGDTTYSLAGGPWNADNSVRIKWSQLTPGDAISFPGDPAAGTGHVMLWGGWMNKEHTEICTMEEYDPGHPASFMTHSVYEDWPAEIQTSFLPIRKAGYVPSTTTCTTVVESLDQIEDNGSLSAVTWSDGHVEVFGKTNSDRALHVWTDGETDSWHKAEEFPGKAECGLASVVSYTGSEHVEVFDPDSAGQTQSMYFQDGWHDFKTFDGRGMTQLSTLRWDEGRTEVFALHTSGRIYHKYYDTASHDWKGWDDLGGQLATGVSAILNKSGDGVLFGTDRDGQVFYNESRRSTGDGWLGWKPMGGKLSSRPSVVREAGGTLEIFGRGLDGKLYGSHSTEAGYSPFAAINGEYQIAGAPAAAIDDGKVAVFVRGTKGKIGVTEMDPKTHRFGSKFSERAPGTFASDPFAWQRPDGRVELFAVTTQGHLTATYHSKTGWTNWKRLATGVAACAAPELQPQCPNGNGLYCGGHGVAGATGTLYSCDDDALTVVETCSAGCKDEGQGARDSCNPVIACNTTSDCAGSTGQCSVCVQPSQMCGGDSAANFCSTDVSNTLGQTCSANAECDPCGTGTMVCGACPATPGRACGGSCCQFAK